MRVPVFAIGLLIVASAAPASAEVIYDTLHDPVNLNATQIANPGTGNGQGGTFARGGPIALEFNVSSSTTINQLQFELDALHPNDGGSVMVYLVPDNGGSPSFTGSGSTLAFKNAVLLGSILDSSLTTSPATYAVGPDYNIAPGTYWLGLVDTPAAPGGAATAQWVFQMGAYTTGIGATNDFFQAAIDPSKCPSPASQVCGTPGVPMVYSLANGFDVYEAEIDVPEPESLAILGAGLAAMGLLRRRRWAI